MSDSCKWCHGSDCDCQDRIDCDKAGEFGHQQCGLMQCGCPAFTACTGEHEH